MLRLKSRVRGLRRGAVTLGSCLLACAGGKETSPEEHVFFDAEGRACRATLEKTSSDAPSVGESVSCEGRTRACSNEAAPCFELNVTTDTHAVMNCPACCRGSASSYVSEECSAVRCESDDDCIYQRAVCADGACECPDGICE